MGEFIEVYERLCSLGKPTLARLNGIVVGGANEFITSCALGGGAVFRSKTDAQFYRDPAALGGR